MLLETSTDLLNLQSIKELWCAVQRGRGSPENRSQGPLNNFILVFLLEGTPCSDLKQKKKKRRKKSCSSEKMLGDHLERGEVCS